MYNVNQGVCAKMCAVDVAVLKQSELYIQVVPICKSGRDFIWLLSNSEIAAFLLHLQIFFGEPQL